MNSTPISATHRHLPLQWLALGALAILLAAFAAYWPSLHGEYLWDDDMHVFENPHMTSSGGLRQLWSVDAFYYPLTSTTFWAARRLFGGIDTPPDQINTTPYHALNILLHGINSILLWLLARRMRVPVAWAAGALFALHPVNVQSVAWITELKNCQSGLFYLLALHAWVRYRQGGRAANFVCSLVMFAAALLSKTSTVVLPFAIAAIDLWRGEKIGKALALKWAPFFGLSLAAGLLTVVFHRQQVESVADFTETLPERVIIAGRAVWFYLGKAVWPVNLAFVYPRWEIDSSNALAYLPAAGVVAVFAVLFAARKRIGNAPIIAWGYYVAALLPILNFFKMYYTRYTYVADHWQYLALMGLVMFLCGAAADALERISDSGKRRAIAGITCASVVAVFAVATWRQSHVYSGPAALWQDTLAKNPNSWMPRNNYGVILRREGRLDEAMALYRESVALRPSFWEAQFNLGNLLRQRGDLQGAYACYLEVIKYNPTNHEAYYQLGTVDAQLGRTDAAMANYSKAIDLKKGFALAHEKLAMIHLVRNEIDLAEKQFKLALEADGKLTGALANLGEIHRSRGEFSAAETLLRRAIAADPDYALAHYSLAQTLNALGRAAEAQTYLAEAARLDPARFGAPPASQ
jgi:tetratricopeptide (TPR) repeat protein